MVSLPAQIQANSSAIISLAWGMSLCKMNQHAFARINDEVDGSVVLAEL